MPLPHPTPISVKDIRLHEAIFRTYVPDECPEKGEGGGLASGVRAERAARRVKRLENCDFSCIIVICIACSSTIRRYLVLISPGHDLLSS